MMRREAISKELSDIYKSGTELANAFDEMCRLIDNLSRVLSEHPDNFDVQR